MDDCCVSFRPVVLYSYASLGEQTHTASNHPGIVNILKINHNKYIWILIRVFKQKLKVPFVYFMGK